MSRFDLKTRSGQISALIQGVEKSIPILDTYTGAAGGYSLRLLNSSYTGSAIRVRRSSDNTELNIGFDDFNNLNINALLSFCGVGNGFVTTWYDQTNNSRHLIQTNASNQPLIVNSGNIELVNGKPAINFDTTAKNLSVAYGFPGNNSFIFDVLKTNDTGFLVYNGVNNGIAYVNVGVSGSTSTLINSGINLYETYKNNIYQAPTNRDQVYSMVSTNAQILLNYKIQLMSWTAFNLSGYTSFEFLHLKQELIIYNTDISSSRAGVSQNINSYYTIY